MESGGFCVSQGGIRWILVCVSGGFSWVLCELGWNQVDSV